VSFSLLLLGWVSFVAAFLFWGPHTSVTRGYPLINRIALFGLFYPEAIEAGRISPPRFFHVREGSSFNQTIFFPPPGRCTFSSYPFPFGIESIGFS